MRSKNKFLIFLGIWFVVNVILAFTTELYADEAYYWMYSQYLDWGYFDHPPGIGILIKIGEVFGHNEFAVRIGNICFVTASLYIMYEFVRPKNPWVFGAYLFCSPMLLIVGFMSLPDGVFLFASLLFLIAFKKFVEREKRLDIFLVALAAAFMVYCKYHAAIVVLFSVLAVPRILLNYRIYLAGLIAVLLVLPHALWQIDNHFPSFAYHLVDRADSGYKIIHTADYVSSNLFFVGGVAAVFLFVASFYFKAENAWHKVLKWNMYGTFVFFILISFKGQFIEANWTAPAFFPLLYVGYKKLEETRFYKGFKIALYVVLPLFVLLRIHVVSPLIDIKGDRAKDFHGAKDFVEAVKETAQDRKICANRYQEASLLNFYGELDYRVSALNIRSRASHYSIWRFETKYCQSDITYLANHVDNGPKVIDRKGNTVHVNLLDHVSFPACMAPIYEINEERVRLKLEANRTLVGSNDDFELQVRYFLPEGKKVEKRYQIKKAFSTDKNTYQWTLEDELTSWEKAEVSLFSIPLNGSNNQVEIFDRLDDK